MKRQWIYSKEYEHSDQGLNPQDTIERDLTERCLYLGQDRDVTKSTGGINDRYLWQDSSNKSVFIISAETNALRKTSPRGLSLYKRVLSVECMAEIELQEGLSALLQEKGFKQVT